MPDSNPMDELAARAATEFEAWVRSVPAEAMSEARQKSLIKNKPRFN